MDDRVEEVPLATQQFWEDFYEKELNNFAEHGDTGEVWFGERRQALILSWILQHEQEIPRSSRFIDVGCGNASLLIQLSKSKFTSLTGLDYCGSSVALAGRIAAREGCEIQFEHSDILCLPECLEGRFDVVLDKGTFDVVYLRADSEQSVPLYARNVRRLFHANEGRKRFFLIASCNCTEQELRCMFLQDFQFFDRIPFHSYTFGHQSGSAVTCLIFVPR
uniref:Protein-lysine N-methyltransferase n=1 Tax=Trichuris muris TaxID=70415 RepID=A0A5S6QX79_TRIMR